MENLTEADFDKKFAELFSVRGRKGTDGRHLLRQLEFLSRISRSFGPRKEISTVMYMISTLFDMHSSIDDYLELQKWRNVHKSILRVVTILDAHRELTIELLPTEDIAEVASSKSSELMKRPDEEIEVSAPVNPNVVRAIGNLESFIIRLEDEYMKSLQQINPHTQEYVIRLSDEVDLIKLIEFVKAYFLRVGEQKSAASMSLMQVEHMYYKHETTAKAIMRGHLFNQHFGRYSDIHPASKGAQVVPVNSRNASLLNPASWSGEAKVEMVPYDPMQKMEQLCSFIYKHGDERSRSRALLCSVYHSALHDKYYQARDLFLISHIQDTIDKSDTKTQILYNRTLVTLGLSAFRMGLIQRAHDCLAGICSGRVKELLAQGQSRWQDKDPDQEKAERRRQIPYHMHINQDLLDCCHLVSAMFLELPNIARSNVQSQIISRTFRKYLNGYSNQVFTGPPENTREHVLASAKALLVGDWAKAVKYLTNLEVWNLIPNDGGSSVKAMLVNRVREEALRLYLITFSNQYDSVSVSQLCEMFAMDERFVRKIVSKMIFNKDISAAWDQVQGVSSLVMYRIDPSPLQSLVLQATEKVAYFVESNERILDPLAGTYGYKEEWVRGDKRDNRNNPARAGGERQAREKTEGVEGDEKPRRKNKDGQWAERTEKGSGRGGRGGGREGGRGGRSRGRESGRSGGRGGEGSARSGNVWGQQPAAAADSSTSINLGTNSFFPSSSQQRRSTTSRGGGGSSYNSRSSATSSYSNSSINRPVLSAVGGRDDISKKSGNSWMLNNN